MVQKGVIRVKKWLFSFGPRMMFLRSASQKNAFLSHFDTVLSHFCPHFDVKMPQKAPFWPQRTLKTTQKGAFWVKNSTFFFWAWKAVFKTTTPRTTTPTQQPLDCWQLPPGGRSLITALGKHPDSSLSAELFRSGIFLRCAARSAYTSWIISELIELFELIELIRLRSPAPGITEPGTTKVR